jgi:hypothetical protein
LEPGEYQACDTTDSSGDYILRSLPASSYLVAFGLEYHPWGVGADQWWEGAATAAEADPLVITPPQAHTGINGWATSPFWPQELPPESPAGPASVSVAPPPPLELKPRPRKCRKGFHRKLVKGKKRCVRKHRPRRRHNR